MSMTLREKTIAKLNMAQEGQEVLFDPKEARLAGIFVEDAIDLDDIINDNEEQEHS